MLPSTDQVQSSTNQYRSVQIFSQLNAILVHVRGRVWPGLPVIFILSLDIYQRDIWKCDHFYILIVYLTEKYMKVWLLLYWVLISNTKNVWKCFISYREIYEIMTALILSLYILQRNIGKYDCSYIESLFLTLLLYWVFYLPEKNKKVWLL